MTVFYTSEAQRDLLRLLEWYATVSDTLPLRFLDMLEACEKNLADFPKLGRLYVGGYRRIGILPFKLWVTYEILGQDIRIVAITSMKDTPSGLVDRLEGEL